MKLSDIAVSVAGETDLHDIIELLNEIDAYYGDQVKESPQERAARTREAILGGCALSPQVIVARNNIGEMVGFAAFSFLWPAAGSSTSLYLKELYVRSSHRAAGIGRILMQRIFDIAAQKNCTRVEWTTDLSNHDAQLFYEKIGVSPFPGKLFYRADVATNHDKS